MIIEEPEYKYLWIMARDWKNPDSMIEQMVKKLDKIDYNTNNLVRVPQQRT